MVFSLLVLLTNGQQRSYRGETFVSTALNVYQCSSLLDARGLEFELDDRLFEKHLLKLQLQSPIPRLQEG